MCVLISFLLIWTEQVRQTSLLCGRSLATMGYLRLHRALPVPNVSPIAPRAPH